MRDSKRLTITAIVHSSLLDCALGLSKKIAVAKIRGFITNWKQPVYFNFDTPINKISSTKFFR